MCVVAPVPPQPRPRRAPAGCLPCFSLVFWDRAQVGVHVSCVVAGEFPASVECVQLAAVAPQLGPARRVGRGPWLRAQSLASPGVEATSLWPLGKSSWQLPGSQVLGLDVPPGPEETLASLSGGKLQPGPRWTPPSPSSPLGFWGLVLGLEKEQSLCLAPLLFHLPLCPVALA